MRLLLLCLLVFSFSLAQPIIYINSDDSAITDFKLSYYIDKSAKLKFEDIKSVEFKEGKNKDTLGIDSKNVWIKIKISNITNKSQTLFLHQSLAYTFKKLEYFEVNHNDEIIKNQIFSAYDLNAKKQLNGSDAVFKFIIHPDNDKTIYIHQTTNAYHFYNYSIFNEKESINYLIHEKVDAVLFVGLLLALAFYNFLIFLSSKYKEYLYYTLYLATASLWIFYIYGSLAHYVHLYGAIAYKFNYGLMLNPIFLALFIQSIFNTKVEYKTEHKFINSIIFVLVINFLFALINFNLALQILSLTLNYSMLIFLGISISIYIKGNKVIKIFLFAHIFYIIFNIYAILFYMGIVDFTYISSHGIGIGIIIEALILSYLVSYKFKVMEEEKEEARIEQIKLNLQATTDSMTKLYNKRYFTEVSGNIISLSKRKEDDLSILIIDIDKFKNINDTYGHQIGDEVISLLANLLIENQRNSDILCRFGGDEFVILLPNCSLDDAFISANKLLNLVEALTTNFPGIENFKFTLSIGVAQIELENETTIDPALKRADDALYEAKEKGRNRVVYKK